MAKAPRPEISSRFTLHSDPIDLDKNYVQNGGSLADESRERIMGNELKVFASLVNAKIRLDSMLWDDEISSQHY